MKNLFNDLQETTEKFKRIKLERKVHNRLQEIIMITGNLLKRITNIKENSLLILFLLLIFFNFLILFNFLFG